MPGVDPQLAADSAHLRLLMEQPGWPVFIRYLTQHRDEALRRALSDPTISDSMTHHYRGMWTAYEAAISLPNLIIATERDQRAHVPPPESPGRRRL